MLKLVYGADWIENRNCLLHTVTEKAASGRADQVIIVPDQFSHEMERRLLLAGGDTISRFAEVLSFSRLAERVLSLHGGVAETPMDNGGRLCAAAAAIEQVRSRLKLYGACAAKPEFLKQLLDTIDECKAFCLTSEELRRASHESTGVLAQKLEEISLLLESYEAVCANGATDASTRLMKLLSLVKTCDYADKRCFYLEGFSDFNVLEYDIIAALLEASEDVTVFLLCDDLYDGQDVFDGVRMTVRRLERIAQSLNAELICQKLPAGKRLEAITYVKNELFSGVVNEYPKAQEEVSLFTCADAYSEAVEAAGRILQLVEKGCRYRDISVACGDMALYRPILDSVFSRYGIVAYYSGNEDILSKPVIRTVLSALAAVTGGMEQEDVFAFLKSGIDLIPADACNRLENYVITWDVAGKDYRNPWTMNPGGLGERPRNPEELTELNRGREILCSTLGGLKDKLYAAQNTGEQVLALDEFLNAIGFEKRLSTLAEQSAADGQLQRAQEYSQLYQILIGALEQIYNLLAKTVRSPEEFMRLVRAVLSEYSVGTIPAVLDGVNVGSIMAMRQNETKYLLILGACDGSFPAGTAETGLLSEEERKSLRKIGLSVAPGRQEKLNRELHGIYNVLCGATQQVTFSAVAEHEAFLFLRLCRMFPTEANNDPYPLAARYSAAAALEYAAELGTQGRVIAQCVPGGMDELEENFRKASYTPGDLSQETVKALYSEKLYLSASRIDQQAKCRLSYFLNYGIKAKERKRADFDAPIYGTFVHYVMEHVARQVKQEGGFRAVSAQRVSELAEKYIEKFTQEEVPDLAKRPERFAYLYERNLREVMSVAQDLFDEMQTTQFDCEGFEVKFGTGGALEAITVVGKRASATLEGFVDRVDIYRNGSVSYVRVVDYKTGKKDFDLTDILNGIGLQMLIYLFALEKGGRKAFGQDLTAGGVLYFPARFELQSNTRKPTEEEIKKARQKERKRKGLVRNDPIVLSAMQSGDDPYYMPFSYKKDGTPSGSLMTTEQLSNLRRYVMQALQTITDEIASGQLQPNPYWRDETKNACKYCAYKSICHLNADAVKKKLRKTVKEEQFWKEVEVDRHE